MRVLISAFPLRQNLDSILSKKITLDDRQIRAPRTSILMSMNAEFARMWWTICISCAGSDQVTEETSVHRRPQLLEHDTQLIVRAKDGDEKAFEQWFNQNSNQVLRFVIWMLWPYGLSHDAEDIALEALSRAWLRINLLHDESRFLSWVIAIAARLCIDRIRVKHRQEAPAAAELLEAIIDEAACCDVREVVMTKEERDMLQAAIALLSERGRSVILLFLQGFSDSEVAEKLGMTVGQVNGVKRRAVEKLQKRLRKDRAVAKFDGRLTTE